MARTITKTKQKTILRSKSVYQIKMEFKVIVKNIIHPNDNDALYI